jgi:ArsR family transcriptional regulator
MRIETRAEAMEVAARWFHALSDATRLRIVELLGGGERCVCELTDELGAAQSRLSFHLRTLKEAGVVQDRREGRWVYYSLDPSVLEAMAGLLREAGEGRWHPRALPVRRRKGCC